jgi:hypothetical protein
VNAETVRNARGDNDVVRFGRSVDPGNDGQFGVALRWYAEALNATEFGLYYINYHSRLPYVQLTGGRPTLGVSVTGANVNIRPGADAQGALAGRFAPSVGCIQDGNPAGFADPRFASLRTQELTDPLNLINAAAFGAAANVLINTRVGILVTTAGSPFFIAPGTPPAVAAAIQAAAVTQATGEVNAARAGTAAAPSKTYGNAMLMNCALAIAQSANTTVAPGTTLPLLVNGAETLGVVADTRLDLIYPENIEMWGFSFNTVVGGWGVQGELSYRPSAPFQTDTDAQTIASAGAQCSFPVAVGDLGIGAFEGQNVGGAALCNPAAINHMDGVGRYRTDAIIYNEMFTFQIGTTATFTTSNPIVEFVGADLGIFLTEFGVVYTPGVESTWLTNEDGTATAIPRSTLQYQNIGCQGSDLPLGGLLALDFKPSFKCRPTNWSFGYVLLARLDYSNFAGTGWLVSPQVSFSHDVEGVTAAPYGNYVEDRMAVSLSVSGTLENKYRVSLGYTNFFGGGIVNKSTDQDFASFSFSYAF